MSRAMCLCFLLLGCGPENPADPDAGSMDAAGADTGSATLCAADSECADGNFCSVVRCLPGAASADARGCVFDGSPCRAGEMCDEAADSCVPESCGPDPDRDNDGSDSIACGGNDCDDDDDQRYGGNTEICDTAHDEDCDDTTVAGDTDGDADEDGFTSAMCCNGATCGDDCDDTDRGVFPGAREICNGRDDDCDGMTDEAGAVPLCPGGVCVAGRCDLAGWSRTFGGARADLLTAVAMDELGNVYVVGGFEGSATFGGPSVESTNDGSGAPTADAFVASYGADGGYRWVRTIGSAAGDLALDVAFDAASGQLFVTGFVGADTDFGGGERPTGVSGFLLALDRDGIHQWDHLIDPGFAVFGAMVFLYVDADDGPVVSGTFVGTRSFGGPVLTASSRFEGFVSRYGPDGSHRWDYATRGDDTTEVFPRVVRITASGHVAFAGAYSQGRIRFGDVAHANRGMGDVFAALLDPSGVQVWDYSGGGPGADTAAGMATTPSDERTYLVGRFEGAADFGAGDVSAGDNGSAFLLELDPSGGHTRFRAWSGTEATNEAVAVAVTTRGDVVLAGTFSGETEFGGGIASAPASGGAFILTLDAALMHRSDRVFAWPGFPTVGCPAGLMCSSAASDLVVGPADSTVVAGAFAGLIDLLATPRRSNGSQDGFVVRLAN